jgi:hypothetical protein
MLLAFLENFSIINKDCMVPKLGAGELTLDELGLLKGF